MSVNETKLYHYMSYCEERIVYAQHRNQEYRILISRPDGEPPQKGYPAIYVLDGFAVFGTFAEAVKVQTRKPHGYEPAVVIGIGYPSGEPFDMNRRCYDFTIPAREGTLPLRPNGLKWPEHGGADYFLDFIAEELMPLIAEEIPIDPDRQTIFGHSLGGLFVLHALFTRPWLFRYFVAGSPSIWWGDQAVLKEKQQFANMLLNSMDKKECALLITVGADEQREMVEDAEKLFTELADLAVEKFKVSFVKFPDEGHVSVLPAAISRTVRFALETR